VSTINDAKQWARDNASDLDASRLACADEFAQMLKQIMPDKSKELWDSGCWLAQELESRGATVEQIHDIQMATGQRAFGGDAWRAAVDYANEFAATGDTKEKGGLDLAEKRHKELFGH
jgi:hypothetical protein